MRAYRSCGEATSSPSPTVSSPGCCRRCTAIRAVCAVPPGYGQLSGRAGPASRINCISVHRCKFALASWLDLPGEVQMSADYQVSGTNAAALFDLKLHRGDGMALVAMNWKNGKR